MPNPKFALADVLEHLILLEAAPRRIAVLAEGVPAERLSIAPGPKDWSAVQALAHLRACADLWGFSIYAMLAANHPSLPDLDERRWAKVRRYAEQDFPTACEAFTRQRQELLEVLRSLHFEDWSRSAEIDGRTHTVFSQVRRLAKHEGEHVLQIEAIILEVEAGGLP